MSYLKAPAGQEFSLLKDLFSLTSLASVLFDDSTPLITSLKA